MRICFSFLILLMLYSCENSKKQIQKKRIGDKLVETVFINDSIYDGETKYYSLSGVLESKINFINGIIDGYAINYYPSGIMMDSVKYINGLSYGDYYFFDSTGKIEYSDFLFFGKKVGKREFYENGKIKEYDFISFDGKPLYTSDYDSLSRISAYGGEIINLNAGNLIADGQSKFSLSIYLLDPPGVQLNYSLGIYNEATKERRIISKIEEVQKPFWDTILNKPVKGIEYFIQADYFDSSNNYHKIHIQPISL